MDLIKDITGFKQTIFHTEVTGRHDILITEKIPEWNFRKTIRKNNNLFYGTENSSLKGEETMNEQIRQALEDEILTEFSDLASLTPGSKDQQTAVENIAKLYRLRLEDERADVDYDEKLYRREVDEQREKDELDRQEREEEFKKNQLAEQTKDRYIRLGMEAAGLILPLMFYAVWMRKGFRFEETGTYTSTTFRGLFNRFRPTKK